MSSYEGSLIDATVDLLVESYIAAKWSELNDNARSSDNTIQPSIEVNTAYKILESYEERGITIEAEDNYFIIKDESNNTISHKEVNYDQRNNA